MSPNPQRRASMYDPARDTYTLSDKSSPVTRPVESNVSLPLSQEERRDGPNVIGSERNQEAPPPQFSRSGSGHFDANVSTSLHEPISQSNAERDLSLNENLRSTHRSAESPSLVPAHPSSVNINNISHSSPPVPMASSHEAASEDHRVLAQSQPEIADQAIGSTENGRHVNSATDLQQQPHQSASPQTGKERTGENTSSPSSRHPQAELSTAQNEKKRKSLENKSHPENTKQDSVQPRSKRRRQEERLQKNRKRGKTPPSAYSRRDVSPTAAQRGSRRSASPDRRTPEFRQRDILPRSPSPIRRSPSPNSAPVRQRKRPGGGARINAANVEALRRRQEERERQQTQDAQPLPRGGVHDVVRQHYNAVPERGREWRKTESKIRGLRSFNNWIKSTLIQKFSPDEEFLSKTTDNGWAGGASAAPAEEEKRLLIVDLGCGKGGDLGKWQQAPQPVDLYVGLDPAHVSLDQARERYAGMRNPRRRNRQPLFHAEFIPKDCFGEWLGDVPIIQRVGIDGSVGPGGSIMSSRWGGGGFDVVVSMFTMHYAFESEEKARQLLSNVAGLLKKGGRFLGVGPNSDVISAQVVEFHKKRKALEASKKEREEEPEDGEVEDSMDVLEWGNSIYRVRFPGDTPEDGIFRPAFGWKYNYFMEEAVEEVPEYVVPWEAFRALTEDYNLELQYRKPFLDIWREEKDDPILGPLSERMGVRSKTDGSMLVNDQELEAASLYHGFCFYKV